MSEQVNVKELIAYIAERTKIEQKDIELVLRYEQTYIGKAKADVKGEVDIDIDDLTDFILSKRDVSLEEPQVEDILEREMDYFMERGLAGYID